MTSIRRSSTIGDMRVLQSISLVMGIGPIDTQRIDQPGIRQDGAGA